MLIADTQSGDAAFWVGSFTNPATYELVSLLGAGGEGEVWRAVLPLSNAGRRDVAIKIIRGAGSGGEDAEWTRFGHLLQALAHPGLVRVTSVFVGPPPRRRDAADRGDTCRYVVMDHVAGPTLRDWIDEHPEATAAERLTLLRMVAAALDEMHSGAQTEVPVAHGDVKPTNIIVTAPGATVLVDLGLVRLTDSVGVAGHSKPYAAPEVRDPGGQATATADAYAFAVTVSQVLTGNPPPVNEDGFLDLPALQAELQACKTTRRRPALVRELVAALSAPAEARPRQLRPWLDNAADLLSQVTGPPAGPAPDSRPRKASPTSSALDEQPDPVSVPLVRQRGRLGLTAIALVLALAGTWAVVASAQGDEKSSVRLAGSGTTTTPTATPRTSSTTTPSSTASSVLPGASTSAGSGIAASPLVDPPANAASSVRRSQTTRTTPPSLAVGTTRAGNPTVANTNPPGPTAPSTSPPPACTTSPWLAGVSPTTASPQFTVTAHTPCPPAAGTHRVVIAELLSVDPSNPHSEYYEKSMLQPDETSSSFVMNVAGSPGAQRLLYIVALTNAQQSQIDVGSRTDSGGGYWGSTADNIIHAAEVTTPLPNVYPG